MFDYLCQYVFTLDVQHMPHVKFNKQKSSDGWIICRTSQSIKYWRAECLSVWMKKHCLTALFRGARLEAAVGNRTVKQSVLHALPCPSFFIVSKFAKDLLNQLKSIPTGLNADTEITLQYDVLGRAMCYI